MANASGGPTASSRGPRRALFVDRDGTLNPDLRYLKEAERLELCRGVGRALKLAHDHGYLLLCVTNQSGIERGYYSAEDVERIHGRLNDLLRPFQVAIDQFYYCPHAPETGCACRKPGVGLFERAAADWHVAFSGSAMVGDRALDVVAARRLGLVTAFVSPCGRSADGVAELRREGLVADIETDRFEAAVLRILALG